ncbi:hypothetical protein LCGC14_1100360 [marine sediment metagenome]|uniref:Uncharacterized protein n=1 Tax=marine sediment metagenome TaxID=412755 RepID=A0A0F9M9M1_9ZZZZ
MKSHGGGRKKVSKKAVKKLKENAKKAPARQYGKAVMKDDPKKAGRKMGYADPGKTNLPAYKYKKKKPTSVASQRSTRKKMY